ncbi:MAG: zinc-ribbon domain containing protein [Anaerolineae bacterium]|nr:zinc-ribbon domain containing protein [Anaerolineae bacterium]
MSDEIIECVKCGRDFIWTEGEQRFFKERNLSRPKLCRECRAQRNNERRPGMRDINTPFPTNTIPTHQPKPRKNPRNQARWLSQPVSHFGAAAITIAIALSVLLALESSLNPLFAIPQKSPC